MNLPFLFLNADAQQNAINNEQSAKKWPKQ